MLPVRVMQVQFWVLQAELQQQQQLMWACLQALLVLRLLQVQACVRVAASQQSHC